VELFDILSDLENQHWSDPDEDEPFASCTFGNGFMCGYVSSQLGSWRWSPVKGTDSNRLTGPESDDAGNTFGKLQMC